MKTLQIVRVSLRRLMRDRIGLALTLLTAPFFVALYALVFPADPLPVDVCIEGAGPEAVERIARQLEGGTPELRLETCAGTDYDIRVIAPELDTRVAQGKPVPVTFSGDATAPAYQGAMPRVQMAVDRYVMDERGEQPRVLPTIDAVAESDARSPFDLYVPGLLIFSIIMLVFSTSMAISREVEHGTLERLRLTRMRPAEYLVGTACAQLALGLISISLTLLVAVLLGFEARGSLGAAALVAALTGVACVGLGTFVGSVARSVARAFLLAAFFMFLLVLFSGVVFPVPDTAVFSLIPTALGAQALHEVLVLGAGLSDVAGHAAGIAALAAAFFAVGWWRFRAVHQTYPRRGTL